MKHLLYNMASLFVIIISLVSCDKDDVIFTMPEKDTIGISLQKIEFTKQGGTQTIEISSNTNWEIPVSNFPTWIKSITPTTGSAGSRVSVAITVGENTKPTRNSFVFFVKYGNESESILIEQQGVEVKSYTDGQYVKYMEISKPKPIVLIFTGDGYIKEDFQIGGSFDKDMNDAIDAFFDIEPYRTYRDYFTVYKIAAYSNERGVSNSATGVTKDTKFKMTWKGNKSTNLSSPDNGQAVLEWCKKIPGVTDITLKKMSIGVIINSDTYAGTCHYWSSGKNIAMMA